MKNKNFLLNFEILGKRIKLARLERNLTQEALAETCHVTVTHLSHIENGGSASLETLVRLCAYLNISMDDALGISAANRPLQRELIDLLITHSYDAQQISLYMLKAFFSCLDIMKEVNRSRTLEDVLKEKDIDFDRIPEIELFEEVDRRVFRPRKYKPEPMAAEDADPIKLPSGKKEKPNEEDPEPEKKDEEKDEEDSKTDEKDKK
ncbi:MAG: helix-turn-helix transcriptional regulator [Firmicutes bacterium]|nr:helix-turn-helix transcriptional regulator [Bacillota bacterium]